MYRFKLNCLVEKIAEAGEDLERLNAGIEKAASIKGLLTDITAKIDVIIRAMGGCAIDKIVDAIETRSILLEKNIVDAGCHILTLDERYCCVSDFSGKPVTWNDRIPLFIQEGIRLIPSSWVLNVDQCIPWSKSDICTEKRDNLEYSPIKKLNQISVELDRLIDRIDYETDSIERDNDDVDFCDSNEE